MATKEAVLGSNLIRNQNIRFQTVSKHYNYHQAEAAQNISTSILQHQKTNQKNQANENLKRLKRSPLESALRRMKVQQVPCQGLYRHPFLGLNIVERFGKKSWGNAKILGGFKITTSQINDFDLTNRARKYVVPPMNHFSNFSSMFLCRFQ